MLLDIASFNCSSFLVKILSLGFVLVLYGYSLIVICLSEIGVPSLLVVSSCVAFLLSSFSSFRLIKMLSSIVISMLFSLYGVLPSLDNCSIILSFVIGAFKALSTILPFTSIVQFL